MLTIIYYNNDNILYIIVIYSNDYILSLFIVYYATVGRPARRGPPPLRPSPWAAPWKKKYSNDNNSNDNNNNIDNNDNNNH